MLGVCSFAAYLLFADGLQQQLAAVAVYLLVAAAIYLVLQRICSFAAAI